MIISIRMHIALFNIRLEVLNIVYGKLLVATCVRVSRARDIIFLCTTFGYYLHADVFSVFSKHYYAHVCALFGTAIYRGLEVDGFENKNIVLEKSALKRWQI